MVASAVDAEAADAAVAVVTAQRTEERAQQILADALAQAAEIEREARDKGMTEAQAAVAAETAQALAPIRERLTQTLDELAHLRTSIALRAERDLVRLALEIAKKVVHREVTIDHEIALTLARVALSRIHHRAVATIHLHPEDYNFVSLHREKA
ncbi:MAG: FliH/SctL family protein [Pyrinomonadaceae bacterium]